MMRKIYMKYKYLILISTILIIGFLFINALREPAEKNIHNNSEQKSIEFKSTNLLTPIEITLNSRVDLFDIGLAKINKDDFYDLFTVNHNFAESFFLYSKGQFDLNNKLFKGIFSEDSQDIESIGITPEMDVPGLYVFSPRRKHIILYCKECSKIVKGQIKISTPSLSDKGVSVKYSRNASYEWSNNFGLNTYALLDIEIAQNGIIVLHSKYFSTKNLMTVNIPGEEVFLGPFKNNPKSSTFLISHSDNHSLAFAKVDNDNFTDAFAAVGGLRANLKYFDPDLVSRDQLLSFDNKGGRFYNKYKNTGLTKGNCRTYKAEWIDINVDGYLDLYLGCANSPNKLYMQKMTKPLQFVESAKSKAINIFHGEEFKWQDWNNDGYPDVLVIEKNQLRLYLNDAGNKFVLAHKSKKLGSRLNSVNTSIKVQDINNNGSLEILVSTSNEIFYFEQNGSDGFRMKSLKSIKLPHNLKGHFSLVDVNLDGLIDIVFFDHGIFLQNKNNKFIESNIHQSMFVKNKHDKFMSQIWFDADSNGLWDVLYASSIPSKTLLPEKTKSHNLMGFKYKDTKKWDSLFLYKNLPAIDNAHWLQIDLIGGELNRDAIGAKVTVKTGLGIQLKYNHGTHDSFHSQGHFRLYYGLGNAKSADVEVIWPDKTVSIRKNIDANQLLKITKG